MRIRNLCILGFIGLLSSSQAFAHARLSLTGSIPPRNASAGLKTGPCGNVARTATPTVLTAGQTLKVQWDEVVDHPGYYRIAFSPAGDAGFDANILAPKINDLPDVHSYETMITVPNTECTNCTIQLIQYMTETSPPSLYYSCADVVIRRAGTPAPSPSPRPSYSPVPGPDCH